MSARGRPLRFVGLVCVLWVGTRFALLWPEAGSLPDMIRALAPIATTPRADIAPEIAVAAHALSPPEPIWVHAKAPRLRAAPNSTPLVVTVSPITIARSIFLPTPPPIAAPVQYTAPAQPRARLDRWSASGWLVARNGSGAGAAPSGQLGGGQAGVRIAYLLAPRQRISAFARVTAPLAGKGSEAAIGVDWQPWGAPIRLSVERRFGIDGTRGGTGAGIVGGLYREAKGLRIDGYGQAGAIARQRIELYADGAIRIVRPLGTRFSLGAGAWGGAQQGAQRLDIGPSAALSLGKVRLSLDWRQRIAGRARPGSGLAVTLGGDF